MVWYVIQEYETFLQDKPFHNWKLIKKCESKDSAENLALKLNFDEYCKGKEGRYPPELTNGNKITKKVKYNIVMYVLKNINKKTGSKNSYWGTGFYIIDDSRIIIDDNEHITDLKELLIEEEND